jgi:hypothetical protein
MATAQEKARSGVVVGMGALTADIKPRIDIDVLLVRQPDTFNLMLLAISSMQKDPKQLGFYALSGVSHQITDGYTDPNDDYRHTWPAQRCLG